MKIQMNEGKYVVAVSGGVDSVVLLDLLTKFRNSNKASINLVVAHYDHGIRPDSEEDRLLVQELSGLLGFEFIYEEGNLGSSTSEEKAREARYKFLSKVQKDTDSDAIITAHHQDDLIETAILNLLRGTGRRGLSSLKSSKTLIRPLLNYRKQDLLDHATAHKLIWREDSTNQDPKYLRNYIRQYVLPKFGSSQRAELLNIISCQKELNTEIDQLLLEILEDQLVDNSLPRLWTNSLDGQLSREIIAAWLRANGLNNYDKKGLERLSNDLKVTKPNKSIDVFSGWQIKVDGGNLALKPVER
jgi:tRNA(Ile)-lysidine synthetase-like protein